ncbi:hypothetical protein NG702_13070 [Pseudarthrobacter sp. MDT3-28]|uniref:hypothetical protein n=1 Tax=Pseudarthrobacter raffinosi TaxID=2953651 RepID=UPI00208FCF2E|nr:hypothetical protein [Pseudarthrobacter sp. MDT3-28]MCO4238333.1 hypothetical protein [Pseudarthrobacter sp. MDT3-28]
MYSDSPDGEYAYTRGVNRKAVIAGTPAAIVALVLALVPAFTYVSGFSWFVGAILAAVTYLLITDRHAPFHAVDGEDIAVAPRH